MSSQNGTIFRGHFYAFYGLFLRSVTYIRVTRNSNEIPIFNSNNSFGHLTQVNRYYLSTRFAFTAVLEYTA